MSNGTSSLLRAAAAALFFPLAACGAAGNIVPEFTLTASALRAMTSPWPRDLQERIAAKPRDFLRLLAQVLDEPADLLVLVDKQHSLASGYVPLDLVSLNGHPLTVSKPDLQLRSAIMPAVLEMNAAAKADGVTLVFTSTYRSYDYQGHVYEGEVATYGRETADRESARPGMSQHQLGTAIDFGSVTDAFAATAQGRWLAAHAWEHGFSLSYPDGYEPFTGYRHESWHYRFITKPAALMQREYFGDVQQYLLVFLNDNRATLEARRVKPGRV